MTLPPPPHLPAPGAAAPAARGYDPAFLGPELRVPLPVAAAGRELLRLTYVHFEVALDPARRLAAFTAVNIEGATLVDVPRTDDAWRLDPRAPASAQTGPEVYTRNDLDRGHLVRRRDPVWGEAAVARAANAATFTYANAAPQASGFNQSKELWLGLEDYVLAAAETSRARISVFTGPVFRGDDQLYRGTRIPRQFWKVAVWATGGPAEAGAGASDAAALQATGYVLDQSPLVDDLPAAVAGAPLLGPFRTFQVPIADIAGLTELDFGDLPDVDRYAPRGVLPRPAWRELESLADIRL